MPSQAELAGVPVVGGGVVGGACANTETVNNDEPMRPVVISIIAMKLCMYFFTISIPFC